mmetsp:Transcript_27901/g.81618  ORF Transcript_27901/g.81618 Transcript_27901/m.81618 type:complete len:230 (+) Transcript_27901:272-961(+)
MGIRALRRPRTGSRITRRVSSTRLSCAACVMAAMSPLLDLSLPARPRASKCRLPWPPLPSLLPPALSPYPRAPQQRRALANTTVPPGGTPNAPTPHQQPQPCASVEPLPPPPVCGAGTVRLITCGSLVAVALFSNDGSAVASLRNSSLMLNPSLADVSMNMMSCSLAHASISADVTCRLDVRSVLLPTSTMTTSLPRCARTSAIHFAVEVNDSRFVMSNTTTATCESRM